ncbi:TRIC cation channel family protein [Isoptericola sp. NEAU-Y5]|uniref:TRIC cation channel family protein n=1 Tax=Isoptericola luteus TaxID=2879484 RepID=A0ABS7ZHY2_9MICO|nr:TRIC cation channel family protein [Isoptericola sp. NEAU-Y5]MCA5894072.1 TRIC cation channel family protein [Isoptericola sp. NEAU-Y5]
MTALVLAEISLLELPDLPELPELSVAGVSEATRWLDLTGVLGCAILGGAVARKMNLDLVGYLIVGIISGLGGGILRDVLLQNGPPVAFTDYAYLPTAAAGSLLAFLVNFSEEAWNRIFVVMDAAVIGLWSVTGVQKTFEAGLGWLPAIILGTVTAVGGGTTRDIILRRIPAIFGGNGLYASVAAASSTVMVVCAVLGRPVAGIVGGILLSLALRLLAVRYGWGLPNGLGWQPHSRLASVWRDKRPKLRSASEEAGGRRRGPRLRASHRIRTRPRKNAGDTTGSAP